MSVGLLYGQDRLDAVLRFPGLLRTLEHALIGAAVAAAVLALSAGARRWFHWAGRLDREFAGLMGRLDPGDVLVLAVGSGLAEELFFRVALQPLLGLGATSLLFGLLHHPLNRGMLPWPFLAAAMGALLGSVYLRTESLVAVALAHGLINYVELRRLARPLP